MSRLMHHRQACKPPFPSHLEWVPAFHTKLLLTWLSENCSSMTDLSFLREAHYASVRANLQIAVFDWWLGVSSIKVLMCVTRMRRTVLAYQGRKRDERLYLLHVRYLITYRRQFLHPWPAVLMQMWRKWLHAMCPWSSQWSLPYWGVGK